MPCEYPVCILKLNAEREMNFAFDAQSMFQRTCTIYI